MDRVISAFLYVRFDAIVLVETVRSKKKSELVLK